MTPEPLLPIVIIDPQPDGLTRHPLIAIPPLVSSHAVELNYASKGLVFDLQRGCILKDRCLILLFQ